MMERPTEDTYVGELVSMIKQIGRPLGFDAEFNKSTPSGKADISLYFKHDLVAVIEVKVPAIALSDPSLKIQAERYAEWYRRNRGVKFYGIHNMRYLSVYKYVAKEKREKTLLEFVGTKRADWVSISDFPFKIMPWAKSINDYKISDSIEGQRNLSEFLLRFKETLEGKSLDLSTEVIETVKGYIEQGASKGLTRFVDLYRSAEQDVRELFEDWRRERGIEKPRDDDKLREFLTLMIKEQHYTFSMKVLFYLVLQNIDTEMSAKLTENLAAIEPSDSGLFQKIFDTLFKYAIEKTGDFEEVFKTNTVDRLPIVDQTLQSLKDLVSYLSQVRWSEINVDIIGRVFEGLIYDERRHLLGQHYTDTMVVDLILAATLDKPGKLIDPGCGSGTFLVRALNYWKATQGIRPGNLNLVEGLDVDKLASMLSKVNLYIQALDAIKGQTKYYPRIYHRDFFKADLPSDYSYAVTNPPYTRQEEMTMAFYDKEYKKHLAIAVNDIADWSKRSSIYTYFLVRAAKLLSKKGKLGFIIENSWLNAEYGGPFKRWMLENLALNHVVESLAERWFEDAAIITNVIVAEKDPNPEQVTNFIFLKKPLRKLFGDPPPSNDYTANQRYYEKIRSLYPKTTKNNTKNSYMIQESEDVRIVSARKDFLALLESKLSSWGILKGPKRYLETIIKYIHDEKVGLVALRDILELDRGLTTNANEIFYLPSKHWTCKHETEQYLVLRGPKYASLRIDKKHLRPLIRPAHLKDSVYFVTQTPKEKREDFVLWISDTSKITDPGTLRYLEWVADFVKEQHEMDGNSFPTIFKNIESPYWAQLPDKSNAGFFLKNNPYRNYGIYLNNITEAQVDKRLFLGTRKVDIDDRILFAVLNSVFTYLGMELIGRSNLGEGVLDVNVVDYNKIPIVNPLLLKARLVKDGNLSDFNHYVDRMLRMRPKDIEQEAKDETRLKIEEYVLDAIGFNKRDVTDFYEELAKLVNLRATRAASTKGRK